MTRLIAKLIGPLVAGLSLLAFGSVFKLDADNAAYIAGLSVWMFAVGYIDGINKPWVDSL